MNNIVTARGTIFPVQKQTEHYLLCKEPHNTDTITDLVNDIEDLHTQGYEFVTYVQHAGCVIFRKRT